MGEDPLHEPFRRLVGARTAKGIHDSFGYESVGDLLSHFPRRYDDRGVLTDLSNMQEGEDITVLARVVSVTSRRMREKNGTLEKVVVTDGTHELSLTFFNQRWLANKLTPGMSGLFAGEVRRYRAEWQLTHPNYAIISDSARTGPSSVEDDLELIEAVAGKVIPIYAASSRISSWRIAASVKVVLDPLPALEDPIPDEIRAREGFADLSDAYRLVHFPADHAQAQQGLRRFRYQEALVLQTVLAKRRQAVRGLSAVPRIPTPEGLLGTFDEQLPFELTDGQVQVASTVAADLARAFPMHRLLQGEVGSGKTIVALRAMLAVVDTGGQAALLAPTEVLAAQHARSIRAMLGPLAEAGMLGGESSGTQVALLTGSQSTASKRKTLLDIASGAAGIVVGTHALLSANVEFFDLGLVVVDEQHRFGVEQRDALRAKGRQPPHVLVMTATPIPRTVAMTVFGDLEVSTLREMPAGRQVISTHVVPVTERPHYLERAWERVREEVAAGHQVYIVCPRIGEAAGEDDVAADGMFTDDVLTDDVTERAATAALTTSVFDLAPYLSEGPLKGLRLEALHGRMPTEAKEDVMTRFAAGDVDALVTTTVIEVGVDVADATVMLVMDADRFGVSQLHQLRGRVGRGEAAGLCLLVSACEAGSPARARLDAVADSLDGFKLSRLDLEQRREGDVLGSSQSGFKSGLKVLRVLRDEDLITMARDDAVALLDFDPELDSVPALRKAVWEVMTDDRSGFMEKA